MSTILRALLLTSLVVVLYGCNTIAGIGKDISVAGEKIEESAKKKK